MCQALSALRHGIAAEPVLPVFSLHWSWHDWQICPGSPLSCPSLYSPAPFPDCLSEREITHHHRRSPWHPAPGPPSGFLPAFRILHNSQDGFLPGSAPLFPQSPRLQFPPILLIHPENPAHLHFLWWPLPPGSLFLFLLLIHIIP